MSDNPFQALPAPEGVAPPGEAPIRSSAEIAAAAAAEAVRGSPTTPPGTTFQKQVPHHAQTPVDPQAAPVDPNAPPEPVAPATPVDPNAVVAPVTPVEPVGQPITFTPEDYAQMEAAGINLPVAPSEVPEGFQAIYAEIAQSVMDSHASSQQQVLDAQEAILGIQAFKARLGTPEGQERMLLSMALNNPDIFAKAQETVVKMGEDPQYGESIRLQLEAQATLEAATRKEQAFENTQLEARGQQVEGRTVRLAQRLGVDATLAKNMVAHKIMQNEVATGKKAVTFQEVDAIVQELAKATRAAPPAVSTPQTQQLVTQTPPTPGQAPGATPASPDTVHAPSPSRGKFADTDHPMDRLRVAVRSSNAAARTHGL